MIYSRAKQVVINEARKLRSKAAQKTREAAKLNAEADELERKAQAME